jgi:hypothetical protein
LPMLFSHSEAPVNCGPRIQRRAMDMSGFLRRIAETFAVF